MKYQNTISKELMRPILKEAERRSYVKYLYIVLILGFSITLFLRMQAQGQLVNQVKIETAFGYYLPYNEAIKAKIYMENIFLILFSFGLVFKYFLTRRRSELFTYSTFNIDLEKEQLIKLIKDHSKTYNISWKNSFVYNDDVVVLKIVEDFYRTRPLVVFKDKISDEDYNFLVNKIENK